MENNKEIKTQRNTIQRDAVLKAVRMMNHPSADEVYERVSAEHSSISRGTVYRNLGVLTENGLVRHISGNRGADRYDWDIRAHYHFQCRCCGTLYNVDLPYMEDLTDRIGGDREGFTFESHDIVFTGLCPDCSGSAYS